MLVYTPFYAKMLFEKEKLYTTKEVAEVLKVSVVTIKKYVAEGTIPSLKFNGIRRFKGADILNALQPEKNE